MNADNGELFGPAQTSDVSLADKIAELERELKMRHAVYPRLVTRGKLKLGESKKRILVLRSILEDYRRHAARL